MKAFFLILVACLEEHWFIGVIIGAFAIVVGHNVWLSRQVTQVRQQTEQTFRLASEFQAKEDLVAALQESEERYCSVVAAMAEGIVLQNADGTICTSNANAERILGLTIEQLMGRSAVMWRVTS